MRLSGSFRRFAFCRTVLRGFLDCRVSLGCKSEGVASRGGKSILMSKE